MFCFGNQAWESFTFQTVEACMGFIGRIVNVCIVVVIDMHIVLVHLVPEHDFCIIF